RRALEAFVRAHPDDPQATPDALLRLALLTDDPAQELPLLETFATRFADHPRRSAVELERARVHALLGVERAAARALGLLTCLERAAPGGGGAARLRPLPGCAPLPGTSDEERGRALWQLGEAAFEAGALDAASDAYRRALAAAPAASAVRPVAGYKLAWSESRAGRFLPALEAVARLLTDGAGALRAEALTLGALCVTEPDWNGDDRPDPVVGVRRPELAAWLARADAWLPELLEVAGRFLAEAQELAAAVECFELLLVRHTGYAHADRVRSALAEARRALRP
ncbi:MAG: hypothetical protein HY908_35825, partial [Myxococcales bacterium]|nr:hypothetical protein [Myxococcales bacterium]